MVPPPEAYDWSNVYGIAFKFQSDTNPKKSSLSMAPMQRQEAFCNSITLDMANLDEITKGHIAQLIDSCPVQFVQPGSPNQRIRNPHEFNSAGREARNWKTDDPANYFNSIYTDDNNIPTDTNADAIVTTPHSSDPSFPPNTVILTVPIKPAKSKAHTAIQVPSSCVTSSPATTDLLTNKLIDSDDVATPSNTTASIPPVTANLGLLQPVGPIADTPSVKAPRYIWTWTYSPNSELVSFCRVQSDSISLKRATSFSPPVQQQDKSPVTAPSVMPSALTRFSYHSAPPCEPANFRWTFNPQSETVVFHRLPKPAPVPLKPSLQLPLPKANHAGIIHASASPTFEKHSAYPSHFCCAIYSNPNQTVFCITKRHRDALEIKMYHLYANILLMNWFYNTFD
eukprot:jgi/Psemu1/42866/gm1.42866_g